MTSFDATRSQGRPVRLRRLCACALLTLAACTGENYFPLAVASGGDGALEAPTVEITAPAANAALNLGDSVQVTATVTSTNGVNQLTLRGVFEGGASAYVQQLVSLSGAMDTTVSRFLQPAGTVTGTARIIANATDLLGNQGADTVTVTVN